MDNNNVYFVAGNICRHLACALEQSKVMAAAREIAAHFVAQGKDAVPYGWDVHSNDSSLFIRGADRPRLETIKGFAPVTGMTPVFSHPPRAQAEPVSGADGLPVVAYMHEDDPTRVVPSSTMDGAKRDGGAILTSLRPYSIPLYIHPTRAQTRPPVGHTDDIEPSRCANCGIDADAASEHKTKYAAEGEWFCSARCERQHSELGCPQETHSGYRHPVETERLLSPTPVSQTHKEVRTSNPYRHGTPEHEAQKHYNAGWNDCLRTELAHQDAPPDADKYHVIGKAFVSFLHDTAVSWNGLRDAASEPSYAGDSSRAPQHDKE